MLQMLIQDRIKLIIKSENLSASEFASKIDIKRSNLSHVLSGRNKPSLDFLAKIISSYPRVNAAWLITGETGDGSFKGAENTESTSETEVKESRVIQSNKGEEKEVKKILVIYSDDTFDTLLPNEQ